MVTAAAIAVAKRGGLVWADFELLGTVTDGALRAAVGLAKGSMTRSFLKLPAF